MMISEVLGVSIELRPYQRDALTAIEAAALRGVQRQVVSLPTGAGKTIIFAHLIVERQVRTLVLVHRDELLHQTLDKLHMVAQGTALDVGVIKAARDEHAGDVVVASGQPLQREARLQRLAQTFGLVVVDECHHALPDNSYGRILGHVGADQADGPLTVGYTATPLRPNNAPLITAPGKPGCFDEVVYTLPLMGLIAQGYLSPMVAKGIFLDGLDLDAVRTRHGDYVEQDLAAALMAADAPEHLVRGYAEVTPGRRALLFCPTVAMTDAVAQAWKAYRRALDTGDDLTVMAAQAILDEGLEAGAHEFLLWQEVSKKIEQLRQLRQTEHKRLVDIQQLISAERANVLLGALLAVLQQAVTTHAEPCTARAILTALSTGVRVLATRPDHHNPASGGSG